MNNKLNSYRNYISLKRKSFFLKRNENLSKLQVFHIFKYKKKRIKQLNGYGLEFLKKNKHKITPRFIDLKKKQKSYIYHARKRLQLYFRFYNFRQFKLTKFIKKFLNNNNNSSLISFELILINILVVSKFFFNFTDAFSAIKAGFVFVNGNKVTNP